MDPLSITASVLTVVGVVGTIAKGLRKIQILYHAPNEFHALVNEVSDLHAVLGDIGTLLQERGEDASSGQVPNVTLPGLVHRANDKLLSLNNLIHDRLSGSHTAAGEVLVSRLTWLRERRRVKELQGDLKNIRQNLATALAILNSSEVSRVELRLHDVSIVTNETRLDQRQFHDYISNTPSEHGKRLDHVTTYLPHVERLDKSYGQLERMVQDLHRGLLACEESDPAACQVDSPLGEDIPLRPARQIITNSFKTPDRAKIDTLRVHAARYGEVKCAPGCTCDCHNRHRFRTPRLLDRFVGSLFVGYSGMLARAPCNEVLCGQRASMSTEITYCFPTWFLWRKLSVLVRSSSLGPEICLRFPRVVSADSKVFTFAMMGDTDSIKSLFSSGLASSRDISARDGYSVMHHAMNFAEWEMAKFLLETGADPYVENDFQICAVDRAWEVQLSSTVPKVEALHALFDDGYLDRRNLTPLHKIVLGLTTPKDLSAELRKLTFTINNKDFCGRTPLSWAAQRGDVSMVESLIICKADPEISDAEGFAPLHYACLAADEGCLRALLMAQADVHRRTGVHETPLHLVPCLNGGNRNCIDLLVAAGADVNSRGYAGRTPLMNAAFNKCDLVATALLDHGADIEIQDDDGWTALHFAVYRNAPIVFLMLLQLGACLTTKTKDRRTLLHIAAYSTYVDYETIDVLTNAPLLCVDIQAIDTGGDTAMDLVSRRTDISQEVRGAFESLFKYLAEHATGCEADSSVGLSLEMSKELDIFSDALEYLESA